MSLRFLQVPVAAIVMAATSGCAPSQVALPSIYKPTEYIDAPVSKCGTAVCSDTKISTTLAENQTANDESAPIGQCPFSVDVISDQRVDTQSLGTVGFTKVGSVDFIGWLKSGFATLPGYNNRAQTTVLKVDLLKAYMHNVATMKSANIVVRIQIVKNGEIIAVKTYRGADDSTNWNSTNSEIQAALEGAFSKILAALDLDLAASCRQTSTTLVN